MPVQGSDTRTTGAMLRNAAMSEEVPWSQQPQQQATGLSASASIVSRSCSATSRPAASRSRARVSRVMSSASASITCSLVASMTQFSALFPRAVIGSGFHMLKSAGGARPEGFDPKYPRASTWDTRRVGGISASVNRDSTLAQNPMPQTGQMKGVSAGRRHCGCIEAQSGETR